jgi:histidinol-phosphatase (PHP family)
MIVLSDIHTHTHFCDGKNSPRQMLERAVEMGLYSYGFSGHAPVDLDGMECDWAMTKENEEKYFAEITSLKAELADKIIINCGCEMDAFSPIPTNAYDYLIGSVHYVLGRGGYVEVDRSPEYVKMGVEGYFGGSLDAYAEAYFALLSTIKKKTDCDVVGHVDLVTKFNEKDVSLAGAFCPENKKYRDAALDCVNELLGDCIFEINTGAMSRGYRSAPYPAPFILEHIAKKGGRVTITGDTHHADNICFKADMAREYARACGVKSHWVLGKNGSFSEYEL